MAAAGRLGVGAHAKHLRNLYVYFWRWATWKVFDQPQTDGQAAGTGIAAFITMAGFLSGPGFQRMRDYLRQRCHEIWVIDCSPEGHQPEVGTRIFHGVQQPVCIVLAARWPGAAEKTDPAVVRWRALPEGRRRDKFEALAALRLDTPGWEPCPSDARSPFLPALAQAWASFAALDDLFDYNGSGVMPGRTWVIAPDAESLQARWHRLVSEPAQEKERLFHPHLRGGKPGDKHSKNVVKAPLSGVEPHALPVADERGDCVAPIRYGFRPSAQPFGKCP